MGRRQEMWGRQEGGGRRLTAEGSDALAVTQAQETTRQRSGRGGVGGKRGGGQEPPRHGCRLSRGDTQISLCKHSGEVGGVKLHTVHVLSALQQRRTPPPPAVRRRPTSPCAGRATQPAVVALRPASRRLFLPARWFARGDRPSRTSRAKPPLARQASRGGCEQPAGDTRVRGPASIHQQESDRQSRSSIGSGGDARAC